MKIEYYISLLLYQYDCVIVPNLGGFVANYKSATIQPIQNTFSPPSKSISFNKNLNNNDGLLANFIAQKETIDFNTAIKKIEIFVSKINQNLKLREHVLIKNVGILFLDAENRIQFEPQNTDNFLLASYGFPVYQKQPIKRATIEDKIVHELSSLTVVKERKNNTKWRIAAAIVIPLAFLAGWIPSQYDVTGDLNYANLNPFNNSSKATTYTPIKSNIQFNKLEKSTLKKQIALADKKSYYLEINFDKNEPPMVIQLIDKPFAEPVSTYVSTSIKDLHYHIIGGCFSKKSNAKRMLRKLKKEGFNASIIGKRKGLWTVSYNSFATRNEAVSALANVKNSNTKAWILNLPINL